MQPRIDVGDLVRAKLAPNFYARGVVVEVDTKQVKILLPNGSILEANREKVEKIKESDEHDAKGKR